MQTDAGACKMYDRMLGRQFLTGFDKVFRYRLEPEFQPITAQNLESSIKLIKGELTNARLVIVIESPKASVGGDARIQWGLIDGFHGDDSIHIDFPLDTEFLKSKSDRLNDTDLHSLLTKNFDLAIVTHISF
jgi:hypothetical protein